MVSYFVDYSYCFVLSPVKGFFIEVMMLYKCNTRQINKYIEKCFASGLVPYVQGSPGNGKSALIKAIADKYDLVLIDIRMTTYDAVELNGYPVEKDGVVSHNPFDVFPLENTPIPKGKNGFLILLDELGQADPDVQKACYRLILDRQVGQHNLHHQTWIAGAGNLLTDKAFVNPMSTALQSRMVSFELEVNTQVWIEDIAIPFGYDSRIIAFLSYMPDKLSTFDPNAKDPKYACPRSWQFLSQLIQGEEVTAEDLPLYAGTIGHGAASDFFAFTQVYKDLPNLKEILKDPENYPVPSKVNLRWATIMHMVDKATEDNLEKLFIYSKNFTIDFRILFFKAIGAKNQSFKSSEIYLDQLVELGVDIHE